MTGIRGDLSGIPGQNQAPFQHIGQFPDIAGPGILLELLAGPFGDHMLVSKRERGDQVFGNGHDVVFALPQGRDLDGKHVDPVEQVLAEFF